MINSAPGETK